MCFVYLHPSNPFPPLFFLVIYCKRLGLLRLGVSIHNNNNNNNNNKQPRNKQNDNDSIERRDSRYFSISTLCRELSPTRTLKWLGRNRAQITCNTSSAYRVQRVVCHMVRRDTSAIKLDSVIVAFILALFHSLKLLTQRKRGGNRSNRRKL